MNPPLRKFNSGQEDPQDWWGDILKMVFKCDDLRNQLLHSHWGGQYHGEDGKKIHRTKTTAKAARGIRVVSEEHSSDYLLDVYDYILNVEWVLGEFFL